MDDVGEADAFGHRHKANVGEALASEISARTGIETVASELTYDLRSGEPDSLDSMVAITFANVAMDLIGRWRQRAGWSAIRDGKYAHAPLPEPGLGPRTGRRRRHVQRRAVPAALRRAARRAAAPAGRLNGSSAGARVDRWRGKGWRARRDSNPRPSGPQPDALSAELRAHAMPRESGGEGGIRTLEAGYPTRRFSKPLH